MSPSPSTNDIIYTARVIRTANPSQPTAEAIAIRDGRVLAVGSLEDCKSWGIDNVDTRFAEKVLIPGFVEAHAHVMAGMYASVPYVGRFARPLPDGSIAEGIDSTQALIERLREVEASMPAGESLICRGFDPIYFDTERLARHHLDEVSATRPIFVFHASGHLATVNSAVLLKYGIGKDHPSPAIGRYADGEPDGELREPAGMMLAREELMMFVDLMQSDDTFLAFAHLMRNAGVTTCTDLANQWWRTPDLIAARQAIAQDDSFPVRVVVASQVNASVDAMTKLAETVDTLHGNANDKMLFPIVKLVLDGSIQGFTAMIDWPGYFGGDDHGQFLIPPEQVVNVLRPFHERNIGIHCHCNGNLTSGVFIDAIELLLAEHAWLDHRHTITHAQLMTHAQMRKARNLGMQANFFVNHVWYWGDQHRGITVGPDRADHINPCATADRIGLGYSVHTDAPVTPPGHLHTMWAAVNRVTPSGRVLGGSERVSVDRAFHAVTIDAAYQLHLDHVIGSLEVGKWADIAVLDEDPYEVDPMAIRDIGVWGTIVGGVIHQSAVE